MNKLSPLRSFIQEVYQVWVSERPNQLAAALAYFGVFSFGAVIYFAYRVASIFINEAAAADRLYARIENLLGTEIATLIQDSVAHCIYEYGRILDHIGGQPDFPSVSTAGRPAARQAPPGASSNRDTVESGPLDRWRASVVAVSG